jgi:hypothetical protein
MRGSAGAIEQTLLLCQQIVEQNVSKLFHGSLSFILFDIHWAYHNVMLMKIIQPESNVQVMFEPPMVVLP